MNAKELPAATRVNRPDFTLCFGKIAEKSCGRTNPSPLWFGLE
jgi:hypothetical protein